MKIHLAGLVLLLAATAGIAGPSEPAPRDGQSPLMFARFNGPAGMTVTFLEGIHRGRTYDAPVVVGFRPGRIYRVKLAGLPGGAEKALYASVEVHGTLRIPPRLRAADFPGPIQLSQEAIEQALGGGMITRVIVVESPDNPLNLTTSSDRPAELEIPSRQDPFEYGRDLGRIVMVVRIGQREPTAEDLARLTPGHILYPGETYLPIIRREHLTAKPIEPPDPALPPVNRRQYPVDENLHDGGDRGRRVHFGPDGNLLGLDPSDSVAEYRDGEGKRRLAVTNTVCLVAPRMISVGHVLSPVAVDTIKESAEVRGRESNRRLMAAVDSRSTRQVNDLHALRDRNRPSANVGMDRQMRFDEVKTLKAHQIETGMGKYLGTAHLQRLTEDQKAKLREQVELAEHLNRRRSAQEFVAAPEGARAIGRVEGMGQVIGDAHPRLSIHVGQDEPPPQLPDQPLQVHKWASAESAQPGDVVWFYIRYVNRSGKPVRDLAVSDHLSPRLEYVRGSAESDREAVFTTQETAEETVVLRWELRDPLPPEREGVVRFQARVR